MIDLYCERTAPGLLAEPVNAFSNLAFFVAAWASSALARRSHVVQRDVQALIVLIVLIGSGSMLFHTYATGWARAADEVPILVFQLWYLWLYARRVIGLGSPLTALLIAAYLVVAVYSRQYQHLLNGSLIYAPALVVLSSIGLYHYRRRRPGRSLLLAAAAVFAVSVTCRSVDRALCDIIPFGTHFLWHVLNSVVLYLSMRALILDRSLALRASTAQAHIQVRQESGS